MQSDVSEMLPVRGNDAAEILINDHDTIKSLLSQLTLATDMGMRQSTLEQLKAVLTIHNATEENLVYPALRQVAGKKWESQRLYHETAEADVLVFKLDTMMKQGQYDEFDRTAEKLQAAVLEHIEDEEQSAFMHLREKADPQQAQMLTDEVRKFRNSMRFTMGASPVRSEMGVISMESRHTTPTG